jgi:Uma2 family endonuclease
MSKIGGMSREEPRTWAGRRISYDDFLKQAPDGGRLEWVDGKVIELSPASTRHQRIVGFLLSLFQHFVEARRPGIVLTAPFQMKTGARLAGREPDILFIEAEHCDRLKDRHLAGPADLVVEVLSPESERRDRVDKLAEYERGGVREYWLIDPLRRVLELRVLGEDGRYRLEPASPDGVCRSSVLTGLWIRADWLWRETPPPLLSVLREWGLI